jgi:HSP20 family protein
MATLARRSGPSGARPARRDPFGDLEELQALTQQLMEGFLPAGGERDGVAWVPPVDIEETEDAWVVEAELPGVDRKDVNVDVDGSELTISGEIKDRERQGILRRRTRRVGRFEYRVTLPGEIDADGVDASLDNGVLKLRVPKPERARPHRIEIKGT